MGGIIDDIVAFVDRGDVPPSVASLVEIVGKLGLRVVAIKLLSWLRFQAKWHNEKPLVLNWNWPWCQDMKKVLEWLGPLRELLEIEGNECNFKPSVSAEERAHYRRVALAGYNPPLRP